MITRDRYHLGYNMTCQSVCCTVPLIRSPPIAVEQNGRDNVNNVDKSGRVAVKNFQFSFFSKNQKKRNKTKIILHRNYHLGQYFNK